MISPPTSPSISLRTYPTPEAARALTWAGFQAFVGQHHYPRPQQLPARFARLQQSQLAAMPDTVSVYREEAMQLATLVPQVVLAQQQVLRDLHRAFQQHPDAAIFASLPGAGEYLAPAHLAQFGDDRQRFLTSMSVQALAGTCPVTEASGKRQVIRFRRGCNREFRYVAQPFALCSRFRSVGAAAY